jgi:predicted phosphodiesterase
MSGDLATYLQEQRSAEVKDEDLVRIAEERGYVIHKPQPPEPVAELDTSRIRGDRYRLAVVSDTHLGSKYQQPTALRDFLAYARRQKVDAIVHAGDVTDGPWKRHRNVHEQWLHGAGPQRDYAIATLPDIGRAWYLISGNHDDWHLEDGTEIVKDIADARDDFTYLGRSDGYVRLGDVLIHLVHPNSGSAYAYSYRLQKLIESYAPQRRPNVALVGNYHKTAMVDARNVAAFLLPSFQSQTPWMAGKALVSDVGGLIIEFGSVTKGLAGSLRFEWVSFREPRENDW